ncbi:DMT family transporter [Rubricoccus marinus]|uniref:DMT family transporter n=1 Tax=Rubricoccus marinus TaxID=716817 RepID=UPI000B9932F2|nr:DMT family transporter [Rubricoccus marinus]
MGRPLADAPAQPGAAPEAQASATASGVPLRVWAVLSVGLATLGASAILIRLAGVDSGLDFRVLVFWRLTFTVALLLPVGLGRDARADYARVTGRDVALVGAAGVLLGIHFLGWFASLAHTSVASATVLVTMSPLFIAILGTLFFRERPGVRAWLAILMGVAGAVLIGLADARGGVFPRALLGNSLALGAAFAISLYLLVGRSVRQRLGFAAYFFPLNVVVLGLVTLVALASGVSLAVGWPTLGLCLVMALGPGLLGHGAFAYSVKYIPAATLGLLSLLEPLVSAVLAVFLFKEFPLPLAIVGMVVVLVSIAAILWPGPARARG